MSAPDVQYQIFDGRFRHDPDRAICMYVADDREDAIRERPEYGDDAVIVAVYDGGDYEIVEASE